MPDNFNNNMDAELERGTKLHGPFMTLHDGAGVIREEYLELEHEIFLKYYSKDMIKEEAVQLAAMCKKLYLFVEGLQ